MFLLKIKNLATSAKWLIKWHIYTYICKSYFPWLSQKLLCYSKKLCSVIHFAKNSEHQWCKLSLKDVSKQTLDSALLFQVKLLIRSTLLFKQLHFLSQHQIAKVKEIGNLGLKVAPELLRFVSIDSLKYSFKEAKETFIDTEMYLFSLEFMSLSQASFYWTNYSLKFHTS